MDRQFSVRRRKYRKRWTEKCKDYFRNFLAFMFSNVGIIGLVVGYTVAGAFIFINIEGDTEELLRRTISLQRDHKADVIWNVTIIINHFNETFWKKYVLQELEEYQVTITQAIKNGFDGTDSVQTNVPWSFPGAFLYALTVITTIDLLSSVLVEIPYSPYCFVKNKTNMAIKDRTHWRKSTNLNEVALIEALMV
ncbi:hypothetical protein FQA39_LY09999 [Lamprigera yunnana]|nr:hypothetical protein FQA39_LY09999 [Lamprigera yunnana]